MIKFIMPDRFCWRPVMLFVISFVCRLRYFWKWSRWSKDRERNGDVGYTLSVSERVNKGYVDVEPERDAMKDCHLGDCGTLCVTTQMCIFSIWLVG
jgi:hypothetical protein